MGAQLTPAGDAFPDWSRAGTLRPELRLRAEAPLREVLRTLDRSLRRAGYRVSDRGSAGFRASYQNWWALIFNDIERTTMLVTATDGGGRTEVLIVVVTGAEHPRGTTRAARAVQGTLDQLRAAHVTVTTSGWRAPSRHPPGPAGST